MDLKTVASAVAVVAALSIAPILASDLAGIDRTLQADVVEDDAAYGSIVTYAVQLCLTLDDTDAVLDVTHNYTTSAMLDVNATTDSDLFAIVDPDATLEQGETRTFELEATSLLDSTGLFTIDVNVEMRPTATADERGFWTLTREVSVEVVLC